MPASTTTTWTGGAGTNDFSDPLNWSAGVPTATTDATIDGASGSPLTVAITAGTIAAKTLTTKFTVLDLSGGALRIVGASTLDSLDQSGGLLAFENSVGSGSRFTGVVTQTAGTLEIDAGSLDLPGGALGGTLDGGGTAVNGGALAVDGLTLGGAAVLENQATITLANGTFGLGDSAQSAAALRNDAAGTIDIAGDGSIGSGSALASIANAGLFEKSGGNLVSSVAAPFSGAGEVLSSSGTLSFLSANIYSGTIDGAGTVAFDAATNTLGPGAELTVAAVLLGGTLNLDTDIAYSGALLTFGNVLSLGTNTLTLSNAADNLRNSTLLGGGTLASFDTLAVDGLTVGGGVALANQGTATLAGGTLAIGDDSASTATLQNNAGAVFDITGDGGVSGGALDARPAVSIANAGIFEKSGGTGTSDIDAPFSGDGIVFANSGVLAFRNSNSYGGTIAGFGAVAFDGNTNTLGASLVLGVATVAAGGTLVFGTDLAFAGVLLANAQHLALGTHTLTLSNASDNLRNTRIDGSGTLKNVGVLTIDGLAVNDDAVLENAGTARLGNASLQLGNGTTSHAALRNDAGAVFDIIGNANILGGPTYNAPNVSIANAGLFEQTAGLGSSVLPTFSNTGTVLVNAGALAFAASNSYGGTIAGSGMVVLAGASNTLNAGVVLTVATLLVGGALTFKGDLSYSGLLLAPAQTLLPSGHTLTLNNGLDTIGGASVMGGGTLVNSATLVLDQVTAGGSVALVNDGTAELVGGAIILGDSAASTASLTNEAGATLEMLSGGSIVGGAAFGHPHVSFVNAGQLRAGAGQFDVFAPFSNPGSVSVAVAGLTLHAANDLSAGTLGGGAWDTTGTIAFAAGGTVATDATAITLDGTGSAMLSIAPAGGAPLPLEATLGSIASGGVLALVGGRRFAAQHAISAAGTIELRGGTIGSSALTLESGATLGGFGSVISGVAGTGLIEATGGELVLNGGSATVLISPGATLELAAPLVGGVTFANGGTATMALDAPTDFTGTIEGLANGDTLDFKNAQVSRASFSGAALLVTIGTATTTYDLGAPITGSGLVIQADADGTGSNVAVSSAAFAQAVAKVNTAPPVDFGNLRMNSAGQATLSVTNAASAPAEALDATITPFGSATAHGSIDLLAAGQTDASDLIVGLTATAPGAVSGSVVAGFFSDGTGTSGNGQTALPSQTLAVTGTFYARALPKLLWPFVLHAGDSNTLELQVANVAAPIAFAEGLRVGVVGASGSISANGHTGLVAPGSTDTSSLHLVIPTGIGIVSGAFTVDVQTDGLGTSGLPLLDLGNRTVPVTVTVDNFAVATIEKTAGSGGLVANGDAVTLDFGTIALGSASRTADLDVLNSAQGPADLLSGTFNVSGGAGFANIGFADFMGVAAGSAGGASSVVLTPGTVGAFNETITLTPIGSNSAGFSGVQPPETLVVLGSVAAATGFAQPQVNTASPIDFGAVRMFTTPTEPLSISNIAEAGAQMLDVSATANGSATATGTIDQLAAGSTDVGGIVAGLDTDTAGVRQGAVILAFSSDNGDGTVTPLSEQDVTLAVAGTIYAEADFAASQPTPVILHVGDSGAGVITVRNTAPAPFAEDLVANIVATGGGLISSVEGTARIAPQSSADIPYTIDTESAGTLTGTLGLGFASDGTGIDNAGPAAIGTETISVAATVNNFATATLQASRGTLTGSDGNYTLDLGTVAVGTGPQTADLVVINSAGGPADFLSGTLTAESNNGFIESGSASFSNLQAGGSVDVEQLTLDPTAPGVFDATFTLQATGANASGFSASVPGATVTVQETVGTGPAIFVTVLGAGGSTVTIPFSTTDNAAAAQIALNRVSDQVRAHALTQLDYTGAATQTAKTPRIGLVELNNSTVPLPPLALANASVSAVLNGAARQVVSTSILGRNTVVSGSAGAAVLNLGTRTEVYFGGGGNQFFTEADLGPMGITPSADVWLDGDGTFDNSAGNTHIHIATVPGGADGIGTKLTVINNGAGTTTIEIGSDTTGSAESDVITFAGTSSAATTVNAAGTAGFDGAEGPIAAGGGVRLLAFVGTGTGFINGNDSNVILFGGATGVVTLLGGAGTDVDAGVAGLIQAGTGGNSLLFSSTIAGSTTLIGGADGDRLSAVGKNTVLIAGPGNESLYAFAPSTLQGLAAAQTPDATTLFQAETGGNTYLPGAGQTSIASVTDANGGNLFQESVPGPANAATISGFVSGLDSISGANPAGGQYTLVTNRAPGPQEMSLAVNGSTSTLTFADGTTWTFNGVVRVTDFINVASRGGV